MARYDEMKSRWLLPEMMRADVFDDAMADIVDEFGVDASNATRSFSVWNAIDDMDESAIDALAEELNILYYDKLATVERKREIVKNCKHVQAKLGTKWAIEEILSIYFTGGAYITEWFDYEEGVGDPNHFRVEAECLAGTGEESARFLAVLSKVKRKSAVLDKVLAVISGESSTKTAVWPHILITDTCEVRRD